MTLLQTIEFRIEGPIMGWKRPDGAGKRRYDPPDQVAYKNYVGLTCKTWMMKRRIPMLGGAIAFGVQVFYPHPFGVRASRVFKTSTPDLDNITKNIKDALKGIAYKDDAQVSYYLPCGKWYLPVHIMVDFDYALITLREGNRDDYPARTDLERRRTYGKVQGPVGDHGSQSQGGHRPPGEAGGGCSVGAGPAQHSPDGGVLKPG